MYFFAILVAFLLQCAESSVAESVLNSYIDLLELSITGYLSDQHKYSFNVSRREKGNDWPKVGDTMVGNIRMKNVRDALIRVVQNNIPGDFIELGVWRGGVCVFARGVLNALGQENRQVHLFDAFSKMGNVYRNASDFLAVSEAQVRFNFAKYHLNGPNVVFHKGYFKDTVPPFGKQLGRNTIAVLRIDGNFYDSYQDAMYYLYEKVPVGGVVIFDDVMSHVHVMKFWNEFRSEQKLTETLIPLDEHSAYFIKEVDVVIDFKFFRKPQDINKLTSPLN